MHLVLSDANRGRTDASLITQTYRRAYTARVTGGGGGAELGIGPTGPAGFFYLGWVLPSPQLAPRLMGRTERLALH